MHRKPEFSLLNHIWFFFHLAPICEAFFHSSSAIKRFIDMECLSKKAGGVGCLKSLLADHPIAPHLHFAWSTNLDL